MTWNIQLVRSNAPQLSIASVLCFCILHVSNFLPIRSDLLRAQRHTEFEFAYYSQQQKSRTSEDDYLLFWIETLRMTIIGSLCAMWDRIFPFSYYWNLFAGPAPLRSRDFLPRFIGRGTRRVLLPLYGYSFLLTSFFQIQYVQYCFSRCSYLCSTLVLHLPL